MLVTDIKWNRVPVYHIICSNLKTPRCIVDFFTSKKIDYYIYEISTIIDGKFVLIKYGMSADNGRDFGDRVYRQIAHCKSWGDLRILGSSGADFVVINELFREQYNFDLDHRNCLIKVYDFTNYPFRSFDYRTEIIQIEEAMIYDYECKNGQKPIGNILEKYSYKDRAIIEKSVLQRIFTGFEN